MITSSNALGEVIPPHFQFSTNTKNDNQEHIWLKTVTNLKSVRGKFWLEDEQFFFVWLGSMKKLKLMIERIFNFLFSSDCFSLS